MTPPKYLQDLVEATFNTKTKDWKRPDCGLSAAYRYSVQLKDGSKVFVKAATDASTESWLRNEHLALSSVRGKFMPEVISWNEQPGGYPVLITRDLSDAYWPASHAGVSWRTGDFERLMEGLAELRNIEDVHLIPAITNEEYAAWLAIAENPESFLQLNFCTRKWFNHAITPLIEAEKNYDRTGESLVHGDVRSDNVCFAGSQMILVDWSHATRGNALYDIANLLPTLHLEGGPEPFDLMPDGASPASYLCGGLIQRLSYDNEMPEWLKKVFMRLIAIELGWAAKCLHIDKPDGAHWRSI
jgi:hypothetical protein